MRWVSSPPIFVSSPPLTDQISSTTSTPYICTGLGKTAQVIAFLTHLKSIGSEGPHLIIVPASTLENWLREFDRFSPGLEVRSYYGTAAERSILRDDFITGAETHPIDVIVTTYNLAHGSKLDATFLKKRMFKVSFTRPWAFCVHR